MVDTLWFLGFLAGLAGLIYLFDRLEEARSRREHERAKALEQMKADIAIRISEARRDHQQQLVDYVQQVQDESMGEDWRH